MRWRMWIAFSLRPTFTKILFYNVVMMSSLPTSCFVLSIVIISYILWYLRHYIRINDYVPQLIGQQVKRLCSSSRHDILTYILCIYVMFNNINNWRVLIMVSRITVNFVWHICIILKLTIYYNSFVTNWEEDLISLKITETWHEFENIQICIHDVAISAF